MTLTDFDLNSFYMKQCIDMADTVDDIHQMDFMDNKSKPWNKLDKSVKFKRLMEFVETYSNEESLSGECASQLKTLLKDRLGRKCLQRVRDVVYDTQEERIISIPSLVKINNKFTLRSETNSLMSSLAPKNRTFRKKE